MRRIQGLCLLLLGTILGWLSGGELARQGLALTGETLWVGVKLLFGLACIFVGLLFAAGLPGWRSRTPDEDSPTRPR